MVLKIVQIAILQFDANYFITVYVKKLYTIDVTEEQSYDISLWGAMNHHDSHCVRNTIRYINSVFVNIQITNTHLTAKVIIRTTMGIESMSWEGRNATPTHLWKYGEL